MKKIFWFTGQSGSGKTTLAYAWNKEFDAIVLDGDEMRESISLEEGFSKEDRRKNGYCPKNLFHGFKPEKESKPESTSAIK